MSEGAPHHAVALRRLWPGATAPGRDDSAWRHSVAARLDDQHPLRPFASPRGSAPARLCGSFPRTCMDGFFALKTGSCALAGMLTTPAIPARPQTVLGAREECHKGDVPCFRKICCWLADR